MHENILKILHMITKIYVVRDIQNGPRLLLLYQANIIM